MSTRSRIAIKQNDGTYKSIYCHSDGYLEHNGYILYNYYQDPIKVNLLISLGNLSSLGQYVYPDTSKKHDFNFPQKNVTVAYHRDRLEDLHFSVNTTLDELKEMVANSDQEYLYLFEDGKWKYAKIFFKDNENIELEDLENALLEHNIIDKTNSNNDYVVDQLAYELVDYAKDFDTYDYHDIYDSDEKAFEDMRASLSKDKIDTTLMWLGNDVLYLATEKDLSDPEMEKLSKTAFNLLCKVNCYKSALEQEKDKEVDL